MANVCPPGRIPPNRRLKLKAISGIVRDAAAFHSTLNTKACKRELYGEQQRCVETAVMNQGERRREDPVCAGHVHTACRARGEAHGCGTCMFAHSEAALCHSN